MIQVKCLLRESNKKLFQVSAEWYSIKIAIILTSGFIFYTFGYYLNLT